MVLTASKNISYTTSNNISVIFYPFNLIMLAIMVPHFAMSSSTSLQSKFWFKPWQQMIHPTWTSTLVLQCHPTRFCFQAERIESDSLVWPTERAHTTLPPYCVAITVLPHILNNPLTVHQQFLSNDLNAYNSFLVTGNAMFRIKIVTFDMYCEMSLELCIFNKRKSASLPHSPWESWQFPSDLCHTYSQQYIAHRRLF